MKKAIGIIGGMGPQASVYLYKMLVELAISEFNAIHNKDFPEIVLHSVPVPDFISSEREKNRALSMLKKRVKSLNSMNLSCLSIACNTAHILLPQLQKISKVPFISIIDETAKAINKKGVKKVGLLGTPSTIKYGLYQNALDKYGISTVIPSEKQISILEKIIRNILKGKNTIKDKQQLVKIAAQLKANGAEAIVLGCTEIPLIFPKNYEPPIYNSLEILARSLLQTYY